MRRDLPTLASAKTEARELRAALAARGEAIGHAAALERVAHGHGFRDWNGLSAAIRDLPPKGWTVGGRVRGTYLSQPFTATVLAASQLRPGWYRLSLEMDEPVDVVRFDSFSNLRKRVQCVLGPEGASAEKTADGSPHVRLWFEA